MLYNTLKILHILSATVLLFGMCMSIKLWYYSSTEMCIFRPIKLYTAFIIIPAAFFQLVTGFMMIGIEHYDMSQIWIKDSTLAFMVAISCWFGFLYFTLTTKTSRYLSGSLLIICGIALLTMIFLMANKI